MLQASAWSPNTPDRSPLCLIPFRTPRGPPDVMTCVPVCLSYQAIELREKWNGLVFIAVCPRPSLTMSIC